VEYRLLVGQVVHRHGFHGEAAHGRALTVAQHPGAGGQRGRQLLGDRRGHDQHGVAAAEECLQRLGVQVVGVDVGHEDEGRRGQAGEDPGVVDGVGVDDVTVPLQDGGGVRHGRE
jgi:hypothetical protein